MPRITVITAVKNAEAFLPETIASVQAQTFEDWQYVIVDDASTDGTSAVAEAAAEGDRRIRVVKLNTSIGAYAAANVGATDVDSGYIARIDGDDVAHPQRFASQLDALANSSAKGCAGAWRSVEGGVAGQVRRVPSHDNGVIKWMMWFRSNLLHSTMMIDTAFFHEQGGYGPELVAEDFRMWGALVRRGLLTVVDELLVDYRISPTQITAAVGARDQPARIEIALDHMRRCDPTGDWSLDDARDLRWIGHASAVEPRRALHLLARFEQAWRADSALHPSERSALAAMTAARGLRHLRHNFGTQRAAVSAAVLRRPFLTTKSGVRAVVGRRLQWP